MTVVIRNGSSKNTMTLLFCSQAQKSSENSNKSSPVMSSATATATSQQLDELLPERRRNSRTYSSNTIHRQTNIFWWKKLFTDMRPSSVHITALRTSYNLHGDKMIWLVHPTSTVFIYFKITLLYCIPVCSAILTAEDRPIKTTALHCCLHYYLDTFRNM